MIFGIGTDIVSIDRMQANVERYGERFARRILTDREFEQFTEIMHPGRFLARRFAAKEAAVKALGTGFSAGINLRQIGVEHDDRGKPFLTYSGQAANLCAEARICGSHVSLTDEEHYAVAFVILEGRAP